jgi:hypothetical protein
VPAQHFNILFTQTVLGYPTLRLLAPSRHKYCIHNTVHFGTTKSGQVIFIEAALHPMYLSIVDSFL